jgi:putative protein kinase ArgK-like GTPase of G3E family
MTDIGWLTGPTHALAAIVGTCGVSVLVKAIDSYFRYREKSSDTAHTFREELHARITELVAQNRTLQEEADAWREKYNESFESRTLLRARHAALCLRFRDVTGEAPPADEGELPPPSGSSARPAPVTDAPNR